MRDPDGFGRARLTRLVLRVLVVLTAEQVFGHYEVKLQAFTSIRHKAVSLQQSSEFGEGARRQLLPSVGVITTAAERLQGSSMTADQMKVRFDDCPDLRVMESAALW